MYAHAAQAQPASPAHGGTAYIQPLVASIQNDQPNKKFDRNENGERHSRNNPRPI